MHAQQPKTKNISAHEASFRKTKQNVWCSTLIDKGASNEKKLHKKMKFSAQQFS